MCVCVCARVVACVCACVCARARVYVYFVLESALVRVSIPWLQRVTCKQSLLAPCTFALMRSHLHVSFDGSSHRRQVLFFRDIGMYPRPHNATQAAWANKSFTPIPVFAEHSNIASAATSLHIACPSSCETSLMPFVSALKSPLLADRMKGVFGQCCRTSGTHLFGWG